jgi:hypothetical protein
MSSLLIFESIALSANTPLAPYPSSHRGETVDNYHGIQIADPYRWLEDDNAPETTAWVEAQNKVTFAFLETISNRSAIRERLKDLWNYERFGVPCLEIEDEQAVVERGVVVAELSELGVPADHTYPFERKPMSLPRNDGEPLELSLGAAVVTRLHTIGTPHLVTGGQD